MRGSPPVTRLAISCAAEFYRGGVVASQGPVTSHLATDQSSGQAIDRVGHIGDEHVARRVGDRERRT